MTKTTIMAPLHLAQQLCPKSSSAARQYLQRSAGGRGLFVHDCMSKPVAITIVGSQTDTDTRQTVPPRLDHRCTSGHAKPKRLLITMASTP